MKSHELGRRGEAFAKDFLLRQGYRILGANYRTRAGEIDLVAEDKGIIVFIEVKTRQEDGWDALEAVTPAKQRRLIRCGRQYLVDVFGREDVSCRFDVLAVRSGEGGVLQGDLIREAFSVS